MRVRRLVTWLLGFPEWLYGRRAAGLDLGPGLIATGWAALMIGKPGMFDRGAFVGMNWLPDAAWIGLMILIAGLHGVGLARPGWIALRVAASLLSAWAWIFVAASLWRVELTTGCVSYSLFGLGSLVAAIHLAGHARPGV